MTNEAAIDQRASKINWGMTIFMIFFHSCAVGAFFIFTWQALAVAVLLWWIAGSLGIGRDITVFSPIVDIRFQGLSSIS
jgi:hypothetical protein